ncbi:MAG: hypothetical protein KJ893_04450 [Candidatus Omnitrophica bacterium]|nr:hypothetical protein [Candidatus Omnitrophota bacterium]MBU4477629.1 hypothetical protein [Candidatus Omnitrophota bacterium]MCG2704305.1 hypothetical protein [Candidatus Omnitrophota bacterium]
MKGVAAAAIQLVFTLFLYGIGIFIIGLAIYPGAGLCMFLWRAGVGYALHVRLLMLCLGVSAAYFIYGICLIFLVGAVRVVFRLSLKEGEYPMQSPGALKWALVNSLVLLVSNTFMDFILLTPFITIFYRLMGAKVGRNVQINSKYCADLSLLEIADEAVIGGHATVICHSFERGRLILKKVKIGRRAVVGLNSVILPGTEIGEHAIIAAGAVLGKNTNVEPRSVYCGVPAIPAKDRRD